MPPVSHRSPDTAFLTAGLATIFPLILGFFALFLPVYYHLATSAWTRDENAHAPFIIAIVIAAFALRLHQLWQKGFFTSVKISLFDQCAGGCLFAFGMLLYWLGRYGEVEIFLTTAQLPIVMGMVVLLGGLGIARQLWFPLAMMLYLIVWPGWLLYKFTAPLKMVISEWATGTLYALGFPVANSGVVISAGPYQLLIADACSGLNSLLAMTAVGAVYLYIVKRQGIIRNSLLFCSLIPIAILANFIRVIGLIWITLEFGYDAGQGFLHEVAGLLMFGIALSCLFFLDTLSEHKTSLKAKPTKKLSAHTTHPKQVNV